MNQRPDRLLVVVALLAPALVLLWPVLVGDQALFTRDIFPHYWPVRAAVLRAFARGELPVWDGSIHAGVPLLANVHAAALYPLNLLYGLLSFPQGYALLVALHLVLAGGGLYLFLRGWVSRAAAVGGALAFIASGPLVSMFEYGPNLMALAWTPWVLWLVRAEGRVVPRAVGVAVAVALQLLAGDPLAVLHSALAGVALVAWSERRRAGAVVLGAGGLVGVLLAGAQVLPSLSLVAETSRGAVEAGQAHVWALHPARLVELFAPHAYGWFDSAPAFWGAFLSLGPFHTPLYLSVYLGATTVLLAGVGVARSRRAGFALSLAAAGVVLALGDQLVAGPLLLHVPPFTLFRYPEKYVVLCALAAAVLAALGLERLEAVPPRRLWGWGLAAVVIAGTAVVLSLSTGALSSLVTGLRDAPAVDVVARSLRLAGLTFAGFATLALAVVVLTRQSAAGPRRVALVALLVVDLLLANQDAVMTTPAALYEQRPGLADQLPELAGRQPARYWRDSVALKPPSGATNYEGRLRARAWELLTLKSSLGGLFGLEELSGYTPMVLTRWNTVAMALYEDRSKLHSLFNTCFIITNESSWMSKVAGMSTAATVPMAVVRQHEQCAGRLFGVARTEQVASLEAAVSRLKSPDFDVRREAVVEDAPSLSRLGEVKVERVTQRDGHLSADVEVGPGGGFLVAAVSYASGWRATVDGREVPVAITNGAEPGFEVPGGRHRVVLEFRQPLLTEGLVVSALTLVACALALLIDRRRARR